MVSALTDISLPSMAVAFCFMTIFKLAAMTCSGSSITAPGLLLDTRVPSGFKARSAKTSRATFRPTFSPASIQAEPTSPTPVTVPRNVYAGILAIRESGLTNMLDRPTVTRLARKMGFKDAAAWLADPTNRRAYAEGIFRGFKPLE